MATISACACARAACGLCGNPFNPTPVPTTTTAPLLVTALDATDSGRARRRARGDLGDPGDDDPSLAAPTAPLCKAPLGTTTASCCFMAKSPRLRVVILCTPPCVRIPGYVSPAVGAVVNGPPLTSITAGTAFGLTFAGRPAAYPVFSELPVDVTRRFGKYAHAASSLLFDFGAAALVDKCGFMKGNGVVLGVGGKGAAQTSLAFTYRWSRFPQCKTVLQPTFETTGCTTKGLVFAILDDTTYLSTDPCVESIVVLNCQQYCPSPDSTPATVPICCSGASTGGCPCRAAAGQSSFDPAYMAAPTCVAAPLPAVHAAPLVAVSKGPA